MTANCEVVRSIGTGSARLVLFSTLVNVPSARSLTPSVIGKVLLSPLDRFTIPGPTISPICEMPKRPIGAGEPGCPEPMLQVSPKVQFGSPGQVNAALLTQLLRF